MQCSTIQVIRSLYLLLSKFTSIFIAGSNLKCRYPLVFSFTSIIYSYIYKIKYSIETQQYSFRKVTYSPLTSTLRPLTIFYFQQTVKKFGNLDILIPRSFCPKKDGGVMPLLSKASKTIFDLKNEGFLSSWFTTDEELFVVLNPSEKKVII